MKITVVLAVLIGILVLACSSGEETTVEQLPNVGSTALVPAAATKTLSNLEEKITATLSVPTQTITPPTSTVASGPIASQKDMGTAAIGPRSLPMDSSCAPIEVDAQYQAIGLDLSWQFSADPRVSTIYVRTRPSGDSHRNYKTNGFGFLWYQQIEVPVGDSYSYTVTLPALQGPRSTVDIDLVTVHSDGQECESRMYTGFEYPPLSDDDKLLTVPDGVELDFTRYEGLTVPEPTVEALVYAFATYTGKHILSGEEPDYSKWAVTADKRIRDYGATPKLRHFIFGPTQDLGDWHASARMIEILAAIDPDLDPRFATTIDEVTFPQFHPLCESWVIVGVEPFSGQSKLQVPCQRDGNGGYFASGPAGSSERQNYNIPDGIQSRGFLYHNTFVINEVDLSRQDFLNWGYKLGDTVNNPCCSANFHETGHAMGLEHNVCGHSGVGFWEEPYVSYMTKVWNQDDLAGIAIHQDPRTTEDMTIDEAADALGIPKDQRYNELLQKPWRTCGNQDPGWDAFADILYSAHIASSEVETNHPTNRETIRWPY